MGRNICFLRKPYSLRKYLYYTCCLCIAVLTLHVTLFYKRRREKETDIYLNHIPKVATRENDLAVHFTVNDILDHMVHVRHGDFVTSSFTNKLPDFVKNYSHQRGNATEKLTVIVVPHSHNDPGYKKTYSEYFHQFTGKILSLIVEKLFQYNDMTFVWPEACFLERWWKNQSKSTRIKFKRIAKSGRLEITSGAWVTADEATPHYFAYLDQMIEGHLWVKQHLGVIPVTSFDMDQFGYSSSVRLLMDKAGIKYSVFKRVHLGIKEYLMKMKLMNFYMKNLANGNRKVHLVQVEPYEWLSFPDSCGPRRDICSDLDFGFNVTLPDPDTPEVNRSIQLLHHHHKSLSSFADKVVQQLKHKNKGYLHNVVLLPHGGDFRYSDGLEWDRQYRNTKILMQYINSNTKYNMEIRFGTLKEYFAEIEKRSEARGFKYPVVSGDFFPYTTGLDYWSGYFTTRQFLKKLGRELQESVRAADILAALVILSGHGNQVSRKVLSSVLEQLVHVRRELSLFQHHDAITGTSAAYVVREYEETLTSALSSSQQIMSFFVELNLFGNDGNRSAGHSGVKSDTEQEKVMNESNYERTCRHVLPASAKGLSKMLNGTDFYLILYNDFTQARYEIVQFLVSSPNISIQNHQSKMHYSFEYFWQGEMAIIFFETKLPPLSLTTFKISKQCQKSLEKSITMNQFEINERESIVCNNSQVNITFSLTDGSPQLMCYKNENFCETLKIGWRHYQQSGGAYTLSMDSQNENMLKYGITIRKLSGDKQCIVKVSHKLITVEYVLRNTIGINGRYLQVNIQTDLSRANVENFVGEISMRLETTIENGDTFYTDSNGLQLLKRKFRKFMPFSSNVYPMSSMAALKDGSRVLNIHTVQPHGVVSREPGILDLFIDRVAIQIDGGLSEAVTDNKLTRTKVFLHFEAVSNNHKNKNKIDNFLPSIESTLINDIVQHPLEIFFTTKTVAKDKSSTEFLQRCLPCDMIIANMKPITDDSFDIEGISLTLFRRLSSKDGTTQTTSCGISSKYHLLRPDMLFNSSNKNLTIKEMSLTHLSLKKVMNDSEKVLFEEMDMKTFLFV